SGDEAIRLCRDVHFDCILIDYRLPDICGTKLMSELEVHDSVASPMIILTAIGNEEIAMEAVHMGAADYIPKHMVSEKSLHRAISNAVERTRLRRAIITRTRALEAANEQLHRKNDQIRRFYHTVSHEIKTPLTAAREFVSLVADGIMGDLNDEQKRSLNYALESCDLIATHFNDLIECTRLDTGKLRLDRQIIDVRHAIDQSVTMMRGSLEAKNIVLDLDVPNELPRIEADASRIVQVLSNLLSNAIKFTDSGGKIGVSASVAPKRPDYLEIAVIDTGIGIAPNDLPRIFERLYQAEQGETYSSNGGLGLGLSIAKDIIALHGGELEVESTPGKGSTFRLVLPLAAG
ncbi:MAG: hybrid sensor histidine kinase/response regulator, partial [Gammaproteobacteria bacterium]|nr:hybrid sensor histidine kinase/response regulator [Gammaproteobacteria bacterium]